jgi:hypothetical protein
LKVEIKKAHTIAYFAGGAPQFPPKIIFPSTVAIAEKVGERRKRERGRTELTSISFAKFPALNSNFG